MFDPVTEEMIGMSNKRVGDIKDVISEKIPVGGPKELAGVPQLGYRLLKGARNMRYFKPCLKRYLLSHVRSRFAEVPAPEWEIATFLPTAQWEKASAGRVYQDSRKASNG